MKIYTMYCNSSTISLLDGQTSMLRFFRFLKSPLDLSQRSHNTISDDDSEAEPNAFDMAIRSVSKPKRTVVTRLFPAENRYLIFDVDYFLNIIEVPDNEKWRLG